MNWLRKNYVLVAAAVAVCFAILSGFAFQAERTQVDVADVAVVAPVAPPAAIRATAPVYSARDFADRVFYQGGGSREWGTLCRLGDGQWMSVHHVTVNGTPVVGPTEPVTAFDEASDWSFIGVDPATLDPADYPEIEVGKRVVIAGNPARDLDGEIIPGRIYLRDPKPPFVWVELLPLPNGGPPEGVVGGISGSCVLDEARKVIGVVHANGFSPIDGTTNTWAMIVPIRDAIREARGEVNYGTASALLGIDPARVPRIETGRFGLIGTID